MNEILDDLDKEKEVIETQWFSVLSFCLVYILYAVAKWHVIGLVYDKIPRGNMEMIFISSIFIVISIELCMVVLLLQKRYLNKDNRHAFYICMIYSVLGHMAVIFNPFRISLDFFPGIASIFLAGMSLIVLSTPVCWVALMMVKYVTANYLDDE